MDTRKIITALLLVFVLASGLFLVFGGDFGRGGDETSGDEGYTASSNPAAEGHSVVAYYFYTTKRCPTCIKIESYTKESILANFGPQLESGVLEFKVVNVDLEENEHYIQDYELTTKSVVIADYVDGEQVAWKNLDKVWDYTGDQGVFVDYIRDETSAYLAELMQ